MVITGNEGERIRFGRALYLSGRKLDNADDGIKWTITDAGDGKYFLTSQSDSSQLVLNDGTPEIRADKGGSAEWEIFSDESDKGKIFYHIQSHGNRLNDYGNKLGWNPGRGLNTRWKIATSTGVSPQCVKKMTSEQDTSAEDSSSGEEDEDGIRNGMVRDRATSSRSLKVSLGEDAEQNSSEEETGLFGPEVESLDSDDDADTDDNTEEQEDDKDSDDEADTDGNTDGNANLAPSDEDQEDDKDSDDEAEPPAEEPREFMMSFQDVEANTLGNLPLCVDADSGCVKHMLNYLADPESMPLRHKFESLVGEQCIEHAKVAKESRCQSQIQKDLEDPELTPEHSQALEALCGDECKYLQYESIRNASYIEQIPNKKTYSPASSCGFSETGGLTKSEIALTKHNCHSLIRKYGSAGSTQHSAKCASLLSSECKEEHKDQCEEMCDQDPKLAMYLCHESPEMKNLDEECVDETSRHMDMRSQSCQDMKDQNKCEHSMVEGKCRATCGKCIPATSDSSPGWGGYGGPLMKATGEPMSQCSATNLLTKIKSGASSAVEEHTVSKEELAALDASFEKRIEDNKQLAKSSTLRQPANLIHCTETAQVVKGA